MMTEERPPDARERTSDMRWDRRARHWLRTKLAPLIRENWYRDVGLIVVCTLLFFGWRGQANLLDEQRDGRRQAVDITCAAVTAVIDAGRATITGGDAQLGSPEFIANLERLGYPPKAVREKQAEQAAEAYASFISQRVEKLTGAQGVVNADGSLNCRKFRALSRVN
jgi:hypothetical protein